MGRRQQCVQNADRQTNMPTQTKEIDRHAHTHAQTHTNTLFPPPHSRGLFQPNQHAVWNYCRVLHCRVVPRHVCWPKVCLSLSLSVCPSACFMFDLVERKEYCKNPHEHECCLFLIRYEYLWADKTTVKKPIQCSAPGVCLCLCLCFPSIPQQSPSTSRIVIMVGQTRRVH